MTKELNEHQKAITKLALRYQQKTAAVTQSVIFLNVALIAAASNKDERLKKAIHDFEKYLKPHSLDYHQYFYGLLLFSLIADFEIFLADVVKELIRRYPKKVGTTQFKLADILNSSSDELISQAAEEYLNRITYKKPSEYLVELANILGIDIAPLNTRWAAFVEAKARRDIGMHNGWQKNDIYLRKLSEVNFAAPENEDNLMTPDHDYLLNVVKVCDELVKSIYDQLMHKYA